MKCIYCDHEREFNGEHVFPAGLGGDDSRYILEKTVCAVCNTLFSKLETELMQKSPTALARIGMQPSGRNRGKQTKEPTLTTNATYIVGEDGRLLEAYIGGGFKSIILPQLHITGKAANLTADNGDSLLGFLAELRSLIESEEFDLIRKVKGDGEASFEVSIVRAIGESYAIGPSMRVGKAPKKGLWLQFAEQGKEIENRFYRTKSKSLAYKTSVEDSLLPSLEFIRAYFQKYSSPGEWAESVVEQPLVQVETSVNLGMADRAIAKIGINFLAYLKGSDYVRHPGFESVKQSILSDEPHLPWTHTENQRIVQLLGTPPASHHALMIAASPDPRGMTMIVMVLKLYGGTVHQVRLAESVPHPGWTESQYFLINYVSHEIRPIEMLEYMARYCDMDAVLGLLQEDGGQLQS